MVAEARGPAPPPGGPRRRARRCTGGAKLEDIFAHIQRGEVTKLNVIAQGRRAGLARGPDQSLQQARRDEVKLTIVHRGVGGITESDVNLANASNATIIGFNVRPDRKARELAEHEGVEIRLYEVIYKALDDIKAAMVGCSRRCSRRSSPARPRCGRSSPSRGRRIAGCYVLNGTITRGSKVRFLREGVVIWKGKIASLKRFKDDVREVQAGYECGIGLENYQDLKPGDIIETFSIKEIPRT